MSQKNVIAELTNLRHVTAAGPGGLSKERATFSVRDVHYSQYGRFCPVQTPEGSSIGVVNHLSLFAKVNNYGFIEVPYRKALRNVKASEALNRIADEDYKHGRSNIIKKGEYINKSHITAFKKAKIEEVKVKPFITDEVEYMDADKESLYKLTHATLNFDDFFNILDEVVPIRFSGNFYNGNVSEIDYVDVDSNVSAGVNFALMPFGHHTEVGRTLVAASNMNQAIPLLQPEAPIVGTGLEAEIAKLSGRSIYANTSGTVDYVDASKIIISTTDKKKITYDLLKFNGSNDHTLIHQIPKVNKGDKVKVGDLLADGASMKDGELAIGTNLLAACMFFDGKTFEDGYAISESVLKSGKLNGVLIKTYIRDIRETKLGPEVLTADIPGVNEGLLSKLDMNGIVRKGARVKTGDILAGVIAPKGDV
jgi:DNA-directed RNA polymerase subunit beta